MPMNVDTRQPLPPSLFYIVCTCGFDVAHSASVDVQIVSARVRARQDKVKNEARFEALGCRPGWAAVGAKTD